jgi:hypothetical protein
MPRATIDREEIFHYDLKTLPSENGTPGGYVDLRRLSYHQMMQRRDIAAKIGWEERRSTGKGKRPQDETIKAMMEVMNVATMEYEFKHSIVQHNLEDSSGNLINFENPESFRNLDPKIGAEIGKYIDDLNQETDEDELENFPTVSKPSFGEETTPPIISDES